MGAYGKVSKTAAFLPQERGEKRGWEIIRAGSENAATVDYFARFPPLSTSFFARWDWKCGQSNTTARKLCLQGWTQPLQSRLYCRLPFSPRKKAHSSRHFTPRLIVPPVPGAFSPGQVWAAASRTPALPPPAAPGWRAFLRLRPLRVLLGLLQLLAPPAVVDHAVDHAVAVLQRHFRRAERIVLLRLLLRGDGKGSRAVAHDEIFSIVRLMVNPISCRSTTISDTDRECPVKSAGRSTLNQV